MVANAICRALCVDVSDRFAVVERKKHADLVVHATIVRVVPTNPTIASLGASFVRPVSVPRPPFGFSGLAVETDGTTRDGNQLGAIVWAKGANSLTRDARVSQLGDAYSLASSFGNDFSKMLVTGKMPFQGLPKRPSSQRLKSKLGGKPKYEACERFGRAPGLKELPARNSACRPLGQTRQARSRNASARFPSAIFRNAMKHRQRPRSLAFDPDHAGAMCLRINRKVVSCVTNPAHIQRAPVCCWASCCCLALLR